MTNNVEDIDMLLAPHRRRALGYFVAGVLAYMAFGALLMWVWPSAASDPSNPVCLLFVGWGLSSILVVIPVLVVIGTRGTSIPYVDWNYSLPDDVLKQLSELRVQREDLIACLAASLEAHGRITLNEAQQFANAEAAARWREHLITQPGAAALRARA